MCVLLTVSSGSCLLSSGWIGCELKCARLTDRSHNALSPLSVVTEWTLNFGTVLFRAANRHRCNRRNKEWKDSPLPGHQVSYETPPSLPFTIWWPVKPLFVSILSPRFRLLSHSEWLFSLETHPDLLFPFKELSFQGWYIELSSLLKTTRPRPVLNTALNVDFMLL